MKCIIVSTLAVITFTCWGCPAQVLQNDFYCPKSRCLFSTQDLGTGTLDEKFERTPAKAEYKGGME